MRLPSKATGKGFQQRKHSKERRKQRLSHNPRPCVSKFLPATTRYTTYFHDIYMCVVLDERFHGFLQESTERKQRHEVSTRTGFQYQNVTWPPGWCRSNVLKPHLVFSAFSYLSRAMKFASVNKRKMYTS